MCVRVGESLSSRHSTNCHRRRRRRPRSHIVRYFYRLMISKTVGRNLFLFLTFGYVFRTIFKLKLLFFFSVEQKETCKCVWERVCAIKQIQTFFFSSVWMMVVSIYFTWFYANWPFCSLDSKKKVEQVATIKTSLIESIDCIPVKIYISRIAKKTCLLKPIELVLKCCRNNVATFDCFLFFNEQSLLCN